MTLEQFASLQPGDTVYVVMPVIGYGALNAPQLSSKKTVKDIRRGTEHGFEGLNAIGFDPCKGSRFHQVRDCFLTRGEAIVEAWKRIDAVVEQLQESRSALAADPDEGQGVGDA